jgi:hypothetical protein
MQVNFLPLGSGIIDDATSVDHETRGATLMTRTGRNWTIVGQFDA